MEPTGNTSTIDYDAASDRIGTALFPPSLSEPTETPGLSEQTAEPVKAEEPSVATEPVQPTVKTYDVPKSWKKEMHEHWGKVTPEAQAYIIEREEQLLNGFKQFSPLRDALQPHLDYLNKQNIQAPYAIDLLLKAHRMLTEGPLEQRQAYYKQLGQNLKIVQEAAAQMQNGQAPAPVDPTIQAMKQELDSLKAQLQERAQRELDAVKTEVQKELDAFAADTKAHPYFTEVATDIAAFVSQGKSLQDAYDMAVWANPVTRAKEQARLLTEHDAQQKENARLSALPKKKAASVNLSSSGEGKAPTEPLGSLDDTIKSTMRELKQRAS